MNLFVVSDIVGLVAIDSVVFMFLSSNFKSGRCNPNRMWKDVELRMGIHTKSHFKLIPYLEAVLFALNLAQHINIRTDYQLDCSKYYIFIHHAIVQWSVRNSEIVRTHETV